MATLDAELAVTVVLSLTAIAVVLFIALLVGMLLVIRSDPESQIEADWLPLSER